MAQPNENIQKALDMTMREYILFRFINRQGSSTIADMAQYIPWFDIYYCDKLINKGIIRRSHSSPDEYYLPAEKGLDAILENVRSILGINEL